MDIWLTVLTSAAVGALVSSGVTLIGQHLERRARRDELLFNKAIDLAEAQREFFLAFADKSGATATLIDPAINAETYFRWFKILLDTGKLPPDADKWRPKPERE
jgi:hypothetical protein